MPNELMHMSLKLDVVQNQNDSQVLVTISKKRSSAVSRLHPTNHKHLVDNERNSITDVGENKAIPTGDVSQERSRSPNPFILIGETTTDGYHDHADDRSS